MSDRSPFPSTLAEYDEFRRTHRIVEGESPDGNKAKVDVLTKASRKIDADARAWAIDSLATRRHVDLWTEHTGTVTVYSIEQWDAAHMNHAALGDARRSDA